MSSLTPQNTTERWPAWASNVIRRLRCLTKGRYFAIIDVPSDGVVDTITIIGPGKVEQVNPPESNF